MPNANARKGSAWELKVQRYLQETLPKFTVTRPRQSGYADLGDIHADPVVIQAKDVAKHSFADWLRDVEAQRVNAGGDFGAVVVKRRNAPTADAYVVMTLATFREIIERLRA